MIIVTGANGFIGSAAVWELNQTGFTDIVAVDTVGLQTRNLLANRTYSKFLLKDEIWDFLARLSPGSVSWIIHMGACSTTTETNWDFLKENNLEYSQRLFTWCAENGANLIYASSAATYGAGEKGFDDRTAPEELKALNLYGESKRLMDAWALKQTATPKHWYGLKFFNVFGPNELFKGEQASVVFKAFNQIQKTKKLQLFRSHNPDYRDGEQKRDFVYVKDITRWMDELMTKTPKNGVYNMGFGQPRTWLDLARAAFNALGYPMQIDWIDIPENIRSQYQYFTEAKTEKWAAQGLTKPQWDLDLAVDDYIKNHLLKSTIL